MRKEHDHSGIAFLTEKYRLIFLIAAWALVQTALLRAGINLSGESGRMIREATNLFEGRGLSTPGYYFYFTEIFLIFLKLKTGAGYGIVVFVQMALNLVALVYLYRSLRIFYRSTPIAFAGCLLLLLCYPYQVYNTFLYTESIFFSLTIIYSCYLLRQKTFSVKTYSIIFLMLVLLCITRPTGLFFIAATAIYLFVFFLKKISRLIKTFLFIAISVLLLLVMNFIMSSGSALNLMLPFKTEMLICDAPAANPSLDLISTGNPMTDMWYYITHNFGHFTKLALGKTKTFFGLTRTYYSAGHNLFITAFFYSLYILIAAAVVKFRRKLPRAFLYFAMIVTAYWVCVLFSCDEWHNRFFLTLTPFIICAALYFFVRKTSGKNPRK